MLKSILFQIKYIFIFKSSFKYKIGYIISLFLKFIYQIFKGKYIFSKFPFKGDYIIENKLGIFQINEPSDMHSILNINFEKDIYEYFLKNKEGIFLDIGANVGKYTIFVGKNTNMKIFSFEPNTFTFNYLNKNINLNNLRNSVDTFNIGLGNKKSQMVLKVPENNFGSASLEYDYNDINFIKTNVKINTIDNIIIEKKIDQNKIRLIKVDVEGFELNVLEGGKNLLKNISNSYIIIEIFDNKEKIIKLLQEYNFFFIGVKGAENFIFYKK